MSADPLVIVGDALLDRDLEGSASRLSPDAPVPVVCDLSETHRPGGAGLAALLAARAVGARTPVVFVTVLADDDGGALLRDLLGTRIEVVAGPSPGPTAEKIRIRSAGQSLLRMDRDQASAQSCVITSAMRDAIESAGAVLVSDYGQGLAAAPELREVLERVAVGSPVLWDPHPRGGAPVPGAAMVAPSLAEACALAPGAGQGDDEPTRAARAARELVGHWRAGSVAVTLGPVGALVDTGTGNPRLCPAPHLAWVDACGAADQFAATAAVALHAGATPVEAVLSGVEASARYAATGGAGHVLDEDAME